jgi:membrane carboxypeptidase/penicillin-binding protein
VGNDDYTPLTYGSTGGTIVAPIWRDFMLQALDGKPETSFKPSSAYTKP